MSAYSLVTDLLIVSSILFVLVLAPLLAYSCARKHIRNVLRKDRRKRNRCATVICDSISTDGSRITSIEIELWKPLMAQLARHRSFTLSSASSRAIPVRRMLWKVVTDPYVPVFTRNIPGMEGEKINSYLVLYFLRAVWLSFGAFAASSSYLMYLLGVHKEIANRIVEPWVRVKVLVTGTEWNNFFFLREEHDAQPDFQVVAKRMRAAKERSEPERTSGHFPYVLDSEKAALTELGRYDDIFKVSSARVARTSYTLFDRRSPGIADDIALYAKLRRNNHWSPIESVCVEGERNERYGPYIGWKSFRYLAGGTTHGDYEGND